MHPALAKDDILLGIFSHLSPVTDPPNLDIPKRPYTYWGPIEITSQRRLLCYPESDEDKLKRSTLASAALTCKTFSELALDELWAAPRGGLYTLLGLLSGFTKTSETHHTHRFRMRAHSVSRFFLDGEIEPDDWTTFLRYAARVRHFAFHTYHQPAWVPYYIDDSVYGVLCERLAGEPLFPRLRYLAWQAATQSPGGSADDTLFRLLHAILLAPNLSVLAFWDPLRHGDCTPFVGYSIGHLPMKQLHMAATTSSSLQDILLECECPPKRSSSIFSTDNFAGLRAAEVTYASWDVLARLGRLPNLQELRGGLFWEAGQEGHESEQEGSGRFDQNSNFAELLPGSMFTALRRVSLDYGPIQSITRFLSAISSRTLNSLTFRANDVDGQSHPEIEVCIYTLCSLPFAAALHTLDMRFDEQWTSNDDTPPDAVAFMGLLEPLFDLRNIEFLSLVVDNRSLSLSERDTERMAISWTHISSLKIMHRALPNPPRSADSQNPAHTNHLVPEPPLSALVSLAECCGQLETLHLPVRDITDDELCKLETRVPSAAPQDKLAEVVLGGCYCGHPVVSDVARLEQAMRRVFPSIKRMIAGF